MAALPEADAESVVSESADARIIGSVAEGEECVAVRGLQLRE